MNSVYLDHAACELPCYEAQLFVRDSFNLSYNPSSVYEKGVNNRQVIESVREKIARKINCDPEEIYFTSGATESNAWAVDGFLKANPAARAISTTIEHSSIDANPSVEKLITVDKNGFLDFDNLENLAMHYPEDNVLWIVQHGNNVIGSIQDLYKFKEIIPTGFLFVDAAQTFGKMIIDVKKMKIDMLSASARKIGGIGGVGFLYISKRVKIAPVLYGSQENDLRGGTYNELGIGAFGAALDMLDPKDQLVIKNRRNFLIDELKKIKGVSLIGTRADRLPGIVLINIADVDLTSNDLVGLLDLQGFMVSADSACHAGSLRFSHVLQAIGHTRETAKTVIRISIGIENTVEDLQRFVKTLRAIINLNR